MENLFDDGDRERVLRRLAALTTSSARRWGRMDVAQALAHCSSALDGATGDRPARQLLVGKVLAPFFRRKLLGPDPFDRDGPTAKHLVVADARDFERERARLVATISKFAAAGPASAARFPHAFLGRLSGDEWGRMMWKHLDHHLRQFGVE